MSSKIIENIHGNQYRNRHYLFHYLYLSCISFCFQIAQTFTEIGLNVDGKLQTLDISKEIRNFTPSKLIYFPTLSALDISGCRNLDTSLFVDCIMTCQSLTEITLVSCFSFSESQLVRILTSLPNLEIVDCTRATPLMFCDAYTIVCALKHLRIINLEPKYEHLEVKDWSRLVAMFLNVSFGHSIKRILPYYGLYVRQTSEDIEEE